MLKVNEIFYSIQGESTNAGLPCIFIRLTYCNLRCSYCDTEYAFYEGKDYSINEIISEIKNYNCNLVEITGGEPLMQEECLPLINKLCELNYTVMLETGGSLPIKQVNKSVKIVLDFKCPSSKMEKKNLYNNIIFLKPIDEVKFVIGNKEDFDWSKKIIKKYNLTEKCEVIFSPVFDKIRNDKLVEWILKENLNVRFQIQLHKQIWEPNKRGV